MSVYDDLKSGVSTIQAMGGVIEEVQLAQDMQEQIFIELGMDESTRHLAQLTTFEGSPVKVIERGNGVKIIYH
jgi:hypothetical protein